MESLTGELKTSSISVNIFSSIPSKINLNTASFLNGSDRAKNPWSFLTEESELVTGSLIWLVAVVPKQ